MALTPVWSSVNVFFGMMGLLARRSWTGVGEAGAPQDSLLRARGRHQEGGPHLLAHHVETSDFTIHIVVIVAVNMPQLIRVETSLSFLGLGISSRP